MGLQWETVLYGVHSSGGAGTGTGSTHGGEDRYRSPAFSRRHRGEQGHTVPAHVQFRGLRCRKVFVTYFRGLGARALSEPLPRRRAPTNLPPMSDVSLECTRPHAMGRRTGSPNIDLDHTRPFACPRPKGQGPSRSWKQLPIVAVGRVASPHPSLYHTSRALSQNWTGVQQYGQLFMLAVQRSHAS